ncbi:MAG: hypothetical protein WC720_01255 [Candidatus Shapirobacteria bacterium]|jgi:hypothetical protein
MNFTEWFSILSIIVGIILFGWDIYLLGESKKQKAVFDKEKEIHKSQVKIWQHYANGLSNSLLNLGFSAEREQNSKLEQAIKSLQTVSFYLYKSLNEERLFSEEEIKKQQLETESQYKQFFNKPKVSTEIPLDK